MHLLGIIRSQSTLFLMLFLENFTARCHAQVALDFMDMDSTTIIPTQESSDSAPCTGGRDCEIQIETTMEPTGFCSPPPEFLYAELEEDYLDLTHFPKGTFVNYKCRSGYEAVAGTKGTVTCMVDGSWSSPDTFCKPNSCGPPPRLEYGLPREEYLERTIFPKDIRVTYVCRLGYVRVPHTSSVVTCLTDGTWSNPRTFCKRKSCGNPGDVENGKMEAESFDFGARVTYVCDPGYLMVSKRNYRDCQEDGTWSNALPECTVLSCPSPPAIENGHYYPNKEEYYYLDSVKYICKGNLALIGEQSIACTDDGKWNSKAPQCRAVQCPNPNVNNGIKITGFSGPFNMNSVVRFRCKSLQYRLIGSDTVRCNQNSEWEPELPKCIGICQYIPRFTYAELVEPTTESTFLEGTTLEYKCKEGFEPVPGTTNTVKCSRLHWSYSDQFCKPITCVDPEDVPHGRIISGSFTYGNTITYACDIGYNIKHISRKCLSDRSWSLPIPECEVQTCAAPGVKDGWYSPQKEKYIYNDTILYKCDEGFQIFGQSSITCRHDGRWNYPTPMCKGICNNPPSLPHAQVQSLYRTDNTFLAGTNMQYMCRHGYYRDHSFTDVTVCLGNFTWTEVSQEFCKIYKCPAPAYLKNGWFDPESTEYLYNDTVTFDCHEGFQLVGQALMTCTNGGRWNYNTPECRGICDNPPDLHYAQPDLRPQYITSYFAGSTVQYTCRPGYILNGIYSNRITCLGNFTWSKIHHEFCDRISCGKPPRVENCTLEAKSFLFEDEVIYECHKGFKMVSQSNSLKCGSNGKWIGTLPVCEAQKCSPPKDLEDGSYSNMKDEYIYGDTVIYKCNSLQLVGNTSITCSDEGKWSSDAPLCKAVCTFPPKLDFAVLEEEFTNQEFFDSGETVQYKCRPGFAPDTGKSNNLTCLDSLKWSQHEVFCTRISCGNPGAISHGQMQYDNFLFGSKVTYTCNPGYSMIAKETSRECQADGTWSGKSPLCKESVCDHIWELQEEARKCTSTPDEWIKYLQIQYLYLQIENLKLEIKIKKLQSDFQLHK